MKAPTTILQTHQLAVGYPSTGDLLQGLDLGLKQGQLCCLLGPNGSGKSTLLLTLSGMLAARGGQVLLRKKNLQQYASQDLARHLSVILTERGIPALRVAELVATGRQPYTGWWGRLSASDHRVIRQAMEDTDTLCFADRQLYTLSDGERQRVMIARAMAQDTPLMILDEPTVHLDLPSRIEIIQLLHQLTRRHQKAILMSTHDLDLAISSADQLWLLQNRTVVSGVAEDLILEGKLEATFTGSNISFDPYQGSFRILNPKQYAIHVEGQGLSTHWTKRALARLGFEIVDDASQPISLSVCQNGTNVIWRLKTTTNRTVYRTLGEVIHTLSATKDSLPPTARAEQ